MYGNAINFKFFIEIRSNIPCLERTNSLKIKSDKYQFRRRIIVRTFHIHKKNEHLKTEATH